MLTNHSWRVLPLCIVYKYIQIHHTHIQDLCTTVYIIPKLKQSIRKWMGSFLPDTEYLSAMPGIIAVVSNCDNGVN